MAIHDAGMFTVKKINRLKILQDVPASWPCCGRARHHATPLQPSAQTLSSVRSAWYE
uniref:Transposase n=1 Tax=Leclercia adecarboxylata TaxID=83655 RepID=A0A482M0K5_9ENTR|nr:Putative transposase [Leclercia adecarboxylata]